MEKKKKGEERETRFGYEDSAVTGRAKDVRLEMRSRESEREDTPWGHGNRLPTRDRTGTGM